MVLFEKALVSSYRPSVVTCPLSLRVSEVLPLLCSSTPPIVSPKFPYVRLGVVGWSLGYEERRCWANCLCNQFPRFPTYVVLIHHRYRQTDDMQSQYHALHYSASRGKKYLKIITTDCNMCMPIYHTSLHIQLLFPTYCNTALVTVYRG